MIFKASHSGRGGLRSKPERAFILQLKCTACFCEHALSVSYGASSPGVGAFKLVYFTRINSHLSYHRTHVFSLRV